MKLYIVRNPHFNNPLKGEVTIEVNSEDDITEKLSFDPDLVNYLLFYYNDFTQPLSRLIYLDGKLYTGKVIEVNGIYYFVYTDETVKKELPELTREQKVLPVKVSTTLTRSTYKDKLLNILYSDRIDYISETEVSFFELMLAVISNGKFIDFVTSENFDEYEPLFGIAEVLVMSFSRLKILFTNSLVSLYRHYSIYDLTKSLRVRLGYIANLLYKEFKEYYDYIVKSDLEKIDIVRSLHNELLFTTKKVNQTIVKTPLLFILLIKPDLFLELKRLMFELIDSIDTSSMIKYIKQFHEKSLQRKLVSISGEKILMNFLAVNREYWDIIKTVNPTGDWVVFYERDISGDYSDEFVIYDTAYGTNYFYGKSFREITDDPRVVFVYPLSIDERKLQFTIDMLFTFYIRDFNKLPRIPENNE